MAFRHFTPLCPTTIHILHTLWDNVNNLFKYFLRILLEYNNLWILQLLPLHVVSPQEYIHLK